MRAVEYVEIDVPEFADTSSPVATETFRFAKPANYLSRDIEAIPSIKSVDVSSAVISLGKDLGERAQITVKLRDHPHIFNGEDFDSGTFWGKWRGRYGAKLRGRPFRLIRGQTGQALAEMDTRHYIIDRTDGPGFDGTYTIVAKDVLKLADDDRAQAPVLSNGRLAGNVSDSASAATLSPAGIGDDEYPASGFLCLGGKEVVAFTRSGDDLTFETDESPSSPGRGMLGTVARSHEAGDRAQLVLRYSGNDVADIIADLLENYTDVPAEYIPLSEWQDEAASHLSVIYARTITEPTSVNKLISQLIEQAALTLWWDDRARRLRLNVLREISTDADEFGDDRILDGSFKVKEQPDKRISQIWTFYGQRDPTDRAEGEDNYRAALSDADLEREAEYGSPEIRKITGTWVATESAAERLNGIQLSRFRDPPRKFAFSLFRGESVQPAEGYRLEWWGSQNKQGERVAVPIQITRVSRTNSALHIEAEEMLASGVVVVTHTVFLLDTGGLQSWEIPDTWNEDDNEIAVIAGGGAGFSRGGGGNGGKGGGAGAFSRSQNVSLLGSPPVIGSPAPTVQYRVGAGGEAPSSGNGEDGGDSFFGGSSLGASIVGAEGGKGGTGRTSGGQGGQASNGVGDLRTSGGEGGNGAPEGETRAGGGGGAGAGGPNGDGADGGNLFSVNHDDGAGGGAADGGDDGESTEYGDGGDNRFGYGGGTSETPTGQDGGGGKGGDRSGDLAGNGGTGEQMWTQTIAPIISAGPGGGGGGAGSDQDRAGHGGLYGGGGGGSGERTRGGDGAQGIIVIRWKEAEV